MELDKTPPVYAWLDYSPYSPELSPSFLLLFYCTGSKGLDFITSHLVGEEVCLLRLVFFDRGVLFFCLTLSWP